MKTFPNRFQCVFALAVAAAVLTGCKSKQDEAIVQAKEQAAKTGQPQTVVTTDKNGNTVTTVVNPPAAGQSAESVVTTVTPAGTPPPPPPSVDIAAGTDLTIRIDQRISVKTNRSGDAFTGEIVNPVADANGNVIIPQGAPVNGVVDVSHKGGHFKGASILDLRLTALTLNGNSYPLETADAQRYRRGKGRRSAGIIAGGTGLGMLVGGVTHGGVGLLAGGLIGGGAGAVGAAFTGNHVLVIPAESVVRFKLQDELVLQSPSQPGAPAPTVAAN
jgi:hypothetical protein